MIKTPNKSKTDKYARQKLAAIPALLLVLAYVIFSGGESSKPVVSTATPALSAEHLASANPASPVVVLADGNGPAGKTKILSEWPEPDLNHLLAVNPFADSNMGRSAQSGKLVSDRDQIVEETLGIARTLEELPLKYSFQSGDRRIVILGDQLLEKGQSLNESTYVHDIQPGRLLISVQSSDRGAAAEID